MKKLLITAGLTTLMGTSAMSQEIGATFSRFDDNWLTVLRTGMVEYASTIDGLSYQQEDASDDLAKQIDQVKNFVAQGVDAIIVNIVDTSAGAAVSAAAGDTPLVYVNREPDNVNELPPTQAFVASNEIESGTLSAFEICKNLRAEGKGNGARGYLMNGQLSNQAAVQRSKDVYDVIGMDMCNFMEIIDEAPANWSRDEAQDLMTNWSRSFWSHQRTWVTSCHATKVIDQDHQGGASSCRPTSYRQHGEATMADTSQGTGGLTFDKSKRSWPNELNILLALFIIIAVFEAIGQLAPYMNGQSFLFDTKDRFDSIFNEARLQIIILQVAIIGIIALGVTQVIITAGIDLSSGPLVAATAMVAMSFGQTELVNGFANPKALFGPWAMDLPVVIPVVIGLTFGACIGLINGTFIAYFRIPPFIATLGMFLFCRGIALWWSGGIWFVILAIIFQLIMSYTVYGKHTYAIGSNEEAARMSGINVKRHKLLVYMIASMLAAFAGIVLSSKAVTAQAGMGEFYELFAIAMAVIGGISLQGGRGSIIGTVLGAMVLGVIRSGFTYIKLDGSYQLMAMGAIIVAAVILDQYRQRNRA